MSMVAKQRRIAVAGERSVGKSSLTVQFVEGHFVEAYYPSIENTFTKAMKVRGQDFVLEILDTAGQDEYTILSSKLFAGIHGYMLVYGVNSKQSFGTMKAIRNNIMQTAGLDEPPPIMLVGNKSDANTQRVVSKEEGQKLAHEMGCKFIETSARYNENVDKAFEDMIIQIEGWDKKDAAGAAGDGDGEPVGKPCTVM